MSRLGIALVVAVQVAAVADASAETRPHYGGSVVGSLLSQPVTVDPLAASSHAELTMVSLMFDTLYRLDASGTVIPHVATELPILSPDGKEARIPVRKGIRFHSGAVLMASDVARSLARVRKSPARWLLAPVTSIQVDADAVVLKLRRKEPELARLLSALPTAITRRGAAPGISRNSGSGAFVLTKFSRRTRRVVLMADDTHFAGRPFVNKLELRWYARPDEEPRSYESGGAHISLRGAVAFTGHQPKYRTRVVESPATLLVYVGFGQRSALLASVPFRRALSVALGRRSFRNIGTGERVVPSVHAAAVDIGGAASRRRALLANKRAGRQILGRSGLVVTVPLEVLIDRTRPDDREIAEKVVAALLRIGVASQIAAVGAREFRRRVASGKCDLYVGQLVAPVASPALATAAAFAAGGDRWAETALRSAPLSATSARAAFDQRLPIVPLFHRAIRAHHRRDVRGAGFRASSRLAFADLFFYGRPKRSRALRRKR